MCLRHPCDDHDGNPVQFGRCHTAARAGVRRGGCTLVATAVASACRGKTSRLIQRTIAWGRVGGRWRVSGWGSAAHLDRGDLRYQRKQARIVRRAVLAVVQAAAVGEHECGVLRLAALVQPVAGAPVVPVVHVAAVVIPVGVVLAVDLALGPRGHAEPAGEAAPVLPSVGNETVIDEDAVAGDTSAVEGAPSADYRHEP